MRTIFQSLQWQKKSKWKTRLMRLEKTGVLNQNLSIVQTKKAAKNIRYSAALNH